MKKNQLLGVLVGCVGGMGLACAAMAQPVNDNCANAIPIASGGVVTAELATATRDGVLSCWNFVNTREVWYTYTASGVEDVTVSLCDSVAVGGAIAGVAAYAGGCGGAEIACSRADYCGSNQPEITFRTTGPGVYTIAVARRGTVAPQTFLVSLSAVPVTAAPSDTCTQALPLAGDRLISFSTEGLTTDGAASCGGTNDGWYLWTPTQTGTAVVATCGFTAGNTVLTAYEGCGGTELACNDDACGTASQISFPVTAETPVLVRLATADGAPASGQLYFFRPETAPPANDTCGNAQEINALGSYALSTAKATTQGPATTCGVGGRGDSRDVFFRYTAAADAWIRADTLYPDPINAKNSTLQILDACGGAVLACNDDESIGSLGSMTCAMHVTAGSSYIIRVAVAGTGVVGFDSSLRLSAVSGPIHYERPSGALPEPAECGALPPLDDVNYGCNPGISPTFLRATAINGACDTYFGQAPVLIPSTTANVFDGYYDADAYVFTLAAPEVITITGQTQFIGSCTLTSVCGSSPFFLWASGWMNPECGAGNFTISAVIPAGQAMFSIQNYGDANATCGHNEEYWFRITGTTPCMTTESCCRGTTCLAVAAGSCTGQVAGSNSVTVSVCAGNTLAGCCFGDYDHNGTKDITDIFTFLNAWFGSSIYADITDNGAGQPDITDIFTFLNAWFGTCS